MLFAHVGLLIVLFGFVVGGYSDYFGFSFTASYFHETNLLNADMLCSVGITGYLTIGNMCLESSLYNQLHDRVRSAGVSNHFGLCDHKMLFSNFQKSENITSAFNLVLG